MSRVKSMNGIDLSGFGYSACEVEGVHSGQSSGEVEGVHSERQTASV